ncbi:unnamed protein product [Brassica oleracea]|uniref:(rape) hypothetical protein n=1 Tax=Brassica napus TaxID=3708 RepID=A0A816J308_BRANA|nr:unnamed protein product [Brassica napus]
MSDITIFPEYRVFLDNSCLASLLMELVLPKFLLVLRSSVAGSLVLKIRDTSIYVLIKGSANWCLITSAFVADYLIVKCAFVAVSVSSFRSLYVFYISQGYISIFSLIGVEFRRLLYHISCLCVMYAYIYLCFSMCSAFVIAVSFTSMALLSSIVNISFSNGE